MPSGLSARERVLRALAIEEVDRVPVLFWGVDPFTERWMAREPSYAPLLDLIRRECEIKRQWWPTLREGQLFYSGIPVTVAVRRHMVNGLIGLESIVQTPLGELRSVRRQVPRTCIEAQIESYIKDEGDVEKFRSLPYAPLQPDVRSYFTAEAELGTCGVVTHRVLTPLGLVCQLVDGETLSVWTRTARPLVVKLLEEAAERIGAYLRHLLENGVKPVFILEGAERATPPMMSPKDFAEFAAAYDRPLLALLRSHGAKAIVHCHGNLRQVLGEIAATAPDGLHPVEEPPFGDTRLEEARRICGGKVCLVGGLQIAEMYDRGEAEIRERIRDIRSRIDVTAGFILTTSATPYEVPLRATTLRNYAAAIEEIRAKQ
ncbi:MAG: uroporphyrinogen decarboxylase family protein [Bacteroidota bacterium]